MKMKTGDIKKKAKELGVDYKKLKKAELVHSIQIAEGNTPCFGESNGECPSEDCCFMGDCLKVK